MRTNPARGSHLPVLIRLLEITQGPVLELGCGMYSTPFLHWACFAAPQRRLVTYEDHPDWFDFLRQFQRDDFHQVRCLTDWAAADLTPAWSVAFVDHDPWNKQRQRYQDVARLTHAEYVVCHDAENASERKYGYSKILSLYRYRWKYTATLPYTWVFSNQHDVTQLGRRLALS